MPDIMNPRAKYIPCVLLVDTSASMSGAAIDELNEGLRAFGETWMLDTRASNAVHVCVINFIRKLP